MGLRREQQVAAEMLCSQRSVGRAAAAVALDFQESWRCRLAEARPQRRPGGARQRPGSIGRVRGQSADELQLFTANGTSVAARGELGRLSDRRRKTTASLGGTKPGLGIRAGHTHGRQLRQLSNRCQAAEGRAIRQEWERSWNSIVGTRWCVKCTQR